MTKVLTKEREAKESEQPESEVAELDQANENEQQEQPEAMRTLAPMNMASAIVGGATSDDNGSNASSINFFQQTYGNIATLRHFYAKAPVQTKLKVNQPGDQYEKEADQIASQVTQPPDITIQAKPT